MQKESPLVGEVYFALCKSVDTPVSLGAWLRFKYNQLALATMDITPEDYLDAQSFRSDYLVVSFLSKYKGLSTGLDLEAEALRKFTTSEESCLMTNRRIRLSRNSVLTDRLSAVIPIAKRKIAALLGPYSTFKVDSGYGWGPGATDDISRRRAFVDTKLCELPISVTRRALPIIRQEIASDLHWSAVVLGVSVWDIAGPFCFLDHVFNLTEECVIDTVPKNAKTHRVIAKEPRANGFLQKGFGSYFRRRLMRVGIDLDDQSKNQRAAKAAVNDSLATLDLKAASDSVSVELVFELLPVDWALALNDVRSHRAVLPNGEKITLQKFSSMGNGFTFELETLLFWALASSVSDLNDRRETLIYGDDIICSRDNAPAVIEVLGFFGFQVNTDKSFIDGPFFESCGAHFFLAEDVTPIYQKEVVDDGTEAHIRLGNRLMRCAHRFGGYDSLDKRLSSAWQRAWRTAGNSRQFQLPLGTEGNDGWLLTADTFTARPQDLNLGIRCNTVSSRTVSLPAHEPALLAWTLRRGVVTESPYGGDVTSSPDTTKSLTPSKGGRWVMPTWEFGLSYND